MYNYKYVYYYHHRTMSLNLLRAEQETNCELQCDHREYRSINQFNYSLFHVLISNLTKTFIKKCFINQIGRVYIYIF